MIRILNAYFPARTVLLGITEAVLVSLAFVASTVLWFGRDANLMLLYEDGVAKIALATAVLLVCMYYLDMYDSLVIRNRREIMVRMVQVVGLGATGMAAIYYAYPRLGIELWIFVTGLVLVLVLVFTCREAFLRITRSLHLAERAVILGNGSLASALATEVHDRPELGVDFIGYIDSSADPHPMNGLKYLGGYEALRELVRQQDIRRVIVTMEDRRGKLPVERLLALKTSGVLVQDGVEVYEAFTGKVPLQSVRLGWLLFSQGFCVSRAMLLYKRVFSIVCSLIALVASLPLQAATALAIWLDSGAPVLYSQKRVGKDGKQFTLYKFRSMHPETNLEFGHRPAEANDERCTRVGKWLRRLRVDELPQLYNILCGDMDFVGPRPFVPDQEAELVKQIPHYEQRWAVKPGATGWAQVHFHYCFSVEDNAEKLAYDLFYIKNMSIGLDLLILFKTIKILLLGRGGR